ncbi:uncharacterized protein [Lepidochelys kempii]|uniref:uncharacterized protein n=1 Tax=Lepidochelys kempii TaxID=8472 RepID=UPI003C6FF896
MHGPPLRQTIGSYAWCGTGTRCSSPPSSSPTPFPVPLQGPLSRSSPRGGGPLAATGWGSRGSASQPKGEGVPVLPHPQGQRGPSPHGRPARAKQIPVKARFLMVSLSTIIPSLDLGDWYAALDMKDAYFHITIFPARRQFLRFTVGREHYQFAVLPFSLAAATRVFTKCMAVVAAFLQRQRIWVYLYLDDWLLAGQSEAEVQGHVEVVLGGSVFPHPMVGRFLKGLERVFPYSRPPVPPWNLNLVLSKLMGPPFEPLAICSLLHLSWKVAFLVAVTSARRVSELRALTSEPPYTVFHKDKVQLRPHPKFLPKVVSQLHLGQDICLAVFFPKPHTDPSHCSLHTLDVRRALAFYLERTKPFRKSAQLSVAERLKGLPVSAQRISSWITSCIRACYGLAGVPALAVTVHSTRAQATSTVFLAQVPIQEICRAATWSSVHTFTTHYAVN